MIFTKQIRKFLYVGAVSTLVDYLIYALLVFIGLYYNIAIVISYSISFLFSFIVTRQYVFEKCKISNLKYEFIVVLCIALISILLNIMIVSTLHEKLEVNLYISRIIAIAIVMIFNYISRRIFVYE